jgi:hypothetical protein
MAIGERTRGANGLPNGLLWAGLAMMAATLILALVGSLYAGRGALYPGPGGMMGPGG